LSWPRMTESVIGLLPSMPIADTRSACSSLVAGKWKRKRWPKRS